VLFADRHGSGGQTLGALCVVSKRSASFACFAADALRQRRRPESIGMSAARLERIEPAMQAYVGRGI
jgi:hypothetical protein